MHSKRSACTTSAFEKLSQRVVNPPPGRGGGIGIPGGRGMPGNGGGIGTPAPGIPGSGGGGGMAAPGNPGRGGGLGTPAPGIPLTTTASREKRSRRSRRGHEHTKRTAASKVSIAIVVLMHTLKLCTTPCGDLNAARHGLTRKDPLTQRFSNKAEHAHCKRLIAPLLQYE